jgi:hypothetical protein
MFLAEVGVGVLFPYTFPTNQFVSVGKKRSSLLTLNFCNVDVAPDANIRAMAVEHHQLNPNASGLIIALGYEAGSSAAVPRMGSIHFPCSRIKSLSRSTASASGMLNFTAVLPT